MERVLLSKIAASELTPHILNTRGTHTSGNSLVLPASSFIVLNLKKTGADYCSIRLSRNSGNGFAIINSGGRNAEYQISSKSGQEIPLHLQGDKIVHIHRTNRSKGAISLTSVSLLGEVATTNYTPGDEIEPEPKIPETKYDTDNVGFNQAFCNPKASIENVGVSLNKGGAYTLPIDSLKKGIKYRLTIFASRTDGNGKLMFGLLPEGNDSNYIVVGDATERAFSVIISPQTQDQQFVSIWRHVSSKGRVKINRIVIEEGVGLSNVSPLVRERHINLHAVKQNPKAAIITSPAVPVTAADPLGNVPIDMSSWSNGKNIESISRRFAILPTPVAANAALNIQGKVNVCGYSARVWLNRLQNVCPNVVYDNTGVVVCDVDNIVGAERVWIKEFGTKIPNLQALNTAKVIYTPSLTNQIMLRSWFKNADVQLVQLPLPKIDDHKPGGDYYVYFESSKTYTSHLFSVWNKVNKLHVVGTRAPIPVFAKYISEYDTYKKLNTELAGSKGLISLDENNHHKSSLIDLALGMGVPVITNNHSYIGKAVVIRHTESDLVPANILNPNLGKLVPGKPDENYNTNIIGTLKKLGVV